MSNLSWLIVVAWLEEYKVLQESYSLQMTTA